VLVDTGDDSAPGASERFQPGAETVMLPLSLRLLVMRSRDPH
jgi:hypothetical protein